MSIPLPLRPLWLNHLVPGLTEAKRRIDHLKLIHTTVQKWRPEFSIRYEYLVAILMVDKQKIETGGRLSMTNKVSPYDVQDRLEFISPFCKHYMLHLDPENLDPENPKNKNWSHARPRLPPVMEEPLARGWWDRDPEITKAALYYDECFKTDPDLDPVDRDLEQEALCVKRDGEVCAFTKKPNIRIFYFIPVTWNDTVDHNNATGILQQASVELADISLLISPGDICSVRELGKSHKAWNMLCVNEEIYHHLVKGHGAFKFASFEKTGQGQALVRLEFFWMPKLPGRFNRHIDNEKAESEAQILSNEIAEYYLGACRPRFEETSELGKEIESGFSINITMPEEDAKKMESVVKVHWACVLFTALCGGAGRAWNLTGMDLSDGSIQPMHHVADHVGTGPDVEAVEDNIQLPPLAAWGPQDINVGQRNQKD